MLEQQVAIVGSEGGRTQAIVRCVDRDVSEVGAKLDGHHRVLNALRETQLEHSSTLREHGQRLERLEGKIDRLEGRFDTLEREMRGGFSTLNVGMAQITALLTRVTGPERD